jgi:translocation and assembly module TamB
MRRAAKWIGWILAVLVGVPIVLVIVVLIGANTGPGRRAIERLTPKLTGDTVRLAGISGRFPDALRVAHVDLRDSGGDYATVDDLSLDWSPMQLLHRTIVIDRLAAARIDVMRMPASSSSTSGSYSLPAPVVLRDLQVARVDIGASIAGTAAAIAVNGAGELTTLTQGHVGLTVHQLDGSGSYVLNGASDATGLHATLHASEPAHGLLSDIAGLPDLGAVTLDGRMDGPRNAVATHVALTAGPLHAAANGTVDLQNAAADLTVSAMAPAMHPRADLAWQSISFDAHVTGPLTHPDATGHLRIDALAAAGVSVGSITAGISGNTGEIKVDSEITGLRLPGPNPDLLAGDPLVIQADARLDQPDRPVHISVRHKLFTADADALTGDTKRIDATMKLADLAPFAAMEKVDLQGGLTLALHAAMHGDATTIALDGTVGVTAACSKPAR